MQSRYARDAARLKAEVVARVEGGEMVRAICGSSGMPAPNTVRNWAKADPAFGEALAAARRRAIWRRCYAFDEAKAAAFLARARAGEPINSLIGQPGMPSRGAYTYWSRTQPGFAEAAFELRRRRDAQLGIHGRARRRGFDQALADRIVARLNAGARDGLSLEDLLRADPALPCWETMMRWRREQPEFDRVLRMIMTTKRQLQRRVAPVVVEEVADHIATGGTFLSFSRLPGAPSRGTCAAGCATSTLPTRWIRPATGARSGVATRSRRPPGASRRARCGRWSARSGR